MNGDNQLMLHTSLVGEAAAERKVVFLHGLFGRGRNFASIAQALRPEVQSMLIDLPNHGRSAWTAHFDYQEMADIVAEFLKGGFGAETPVDVVGHSMGGKVAMVLALRHPEIVRRLVVVDIAPVSSASGRGEFQHLLSSLAALPLDTLQNRSEADEALRSSISHTGVRTFLLQNLKRDGEGFAWEPNLRLLYAELEKIMAFPSFENTAFEGLVLWIKGEKSRYIADEDGPIMRSLFPRTRKITIRGAGHWVHSERPQEVIAALRQFLLAD